MAIISGTHFQGAHNLPDYQPTADINAHPLPTQGATAQPPQLRSDPKQWSSDSGKKACPNTTQTCAWPAESYRVTFLVDW